MVGGESGEILMKVDNKVSDSTAYVVLRRRKCRIMKIAVEA